MSVVLRKDIDAAPSYIDLLHKIQVPDAKLEINPEDLNKESSILFYTAASYVKTKLHVYSIYLPRYLRRLLQTERYWPLNMQFNEPGKLLIVTGYNVDESFHGMLHYEVKLY